MTLRKEEKGIFELKMTFASDFAHILRSQRHLLRQEDRIKPGISSQGTGRALYSFLSELPWK